MYLAEAQILKSSKIFYRIWGLKCLKNQRRKRRNRVIAVKQIDIFLLHGISKEVKAETYYNVFIEGIEKYLQKSQLVRWHPIDYSFLLREKGDKLFIWMNKFWHQKSRRWGCDYIIDILSLTQKDRPLKEGDYYYDLFSLLSAQYDKISSQYPDSKKVLIGHSAGGQLGYTFTWRRHFDTLITMGAPLTWFSAGFNDYGQMNPDLRKWYNFWKKGDRVASTISENPTFSAVHDIQVKSWNPLNLLTAKAHSDYWKSDFKHKTIANILTELEKP